MTEIVYRTADVPFPADKVAMTMGFFDGMHRGHRKLISDVCFYASANGLKSCVFTYFNHPMTVLSPGTTPFLLSLPEERFELLSGLRPDYIAVNDFTPEFADMEPSEFIGEVLTGRMHAEYICIGRNHRFGRNAAGTPDLLLSSAIRTKVMDPVSIDGQRVSSSAIRTAIAGGDMEKAEAMLGRPHRIRCFSHGSDPSICFSDSRRAFPPDGEYEGMMDGEPCRFTFSIEDPCGSRGRAVIRIKSEACKPRKDAYTLSFSKRVLTPLS